METITAVMLTRAGRTTGYDEVSDAPLVTPGRELGVSRVEIPLDGLTAGELVLAVPAAELKGSEDHFCIRVTFE